MAYPLKAGNFTNFGPRTILGRPDLASLIGCICADWSYVEYSTASFYSLLMGVYIDIVPGYEPPTHPVARQIMDALPSNHAKLDLLDRLATWVIKDEDLLADVKSVIKKTRGSSKERNKVAHGVWGVSEAEPDAVILITPFGHKMVYKKNDFEKILKAIHQTNAEMMRVHHAFYMQRRALAFKDQ